MSTIIIVSSEHHAPAPIICNLGQTSLIITSDYGAPDAFELATPVMSEADSGDAPQNTTVILDHDETYCLYRCLQELFQPVANTIDNR